MFRIRTIGKIALTPIAASLAYETYQFRNYSDKHMMIEASSNTSEVNKFILSNGIT